MSVQDPTLLGIAAILTSTAGMVTTVVGARRAARESREKAEEGCREQLRAARAEAEAAAAALHELRMRPPL